jgi:hypothetical protein
MGYISALKEFHNDLLRESGGRVRDIIPVTPDTYADDYVHSIRAETLINFILTELLPVAYAAEGKNNMADYISISPLIDIENRGSASKTLKHLQTAPTELLHEARAVNKITERMNERGYINAQSRLRRLINAVDNYYKTNTPHDCPLATEQLHAPLPELALNDVGYYIGSLRNQVYATEVLRDIIKCLTFKKDKLVALRKLRSLISRLESVYREDAIIKAILVKLGVFDFYVTAPPGMSIYEEYMSASERCLDLLRHLAANFLPYGKAERLYDSITKIEATRASLRNLHNAGRQDLAVGYDETLKERLADAFELAVALSPRPDETLDYILDAFGV